MPLAKRRIAKISDQELLQHAALLAFEISSRQLAHAFFNYLGHVHGFSFDVNPIDQSYESDQPQYRVLNINGYFNHPDGREKLLEVIEGAEAIIKSGKPIYTADCLSMGAPL